VTPEQIVQRVQVIIEWDAQSPVQDVVLFDEIVDLVRPRLEALNLNPDVYATIPQRTTGGAE
jgi:hypothetical protein